MRILLDVDGVAAEWTPAVAAVIKRVAGIEMDQTKWFRATDLPAESRGKVMSIISGEGFCRTLQPLRGAVEGVAELRRLGHEVRFVTSLWGSKTWAYDRNIWLREHGFAPDAPRGVTYSRDKYEVFGNVFVDDKPSNVQAWQNAWPHQRAVIFDQPWNRDAEGVRVTDWENLLSFVKWHAGA